MRKSLCLQVPSWEYISREWWEHPGLHFNLNLPITPVTDLRIHWGDLIASTSEGHLDPR